MQRIGLTGGIGSGKSTVGAELLALGALLVDTDAIARSLTQPDGAAMPAIAAQFGIEMLASDGSLDRSRMRDLVFADAKSKARLEGILHPLIGQACEAQAAAAIDRPVVFDVPLLVESGRWRMRVDRVLVVDARESTQVARVMARSEWSADAVQAVMAVQATRAERRSNADAVIFNDGLSRAELAAEVRALWLRWGLAPTR